MNGESEILRNKVHQQEEHTKYIETDDSCKNQGNSHMFLQPMHSKCIYMLRANSNANAALLVADEAYSSVLLAMCIAMETQIAKEHADNEQDE